MIEEIKVLLCDKMLYISLYALAITFVIIIVIVKSRKKRKRYMILKTEKINLLGIYNQEWEHSADKFTEELFEENQRLEKEVKVLRQEKVNLSFGQFILLMFFIISLLFKSKDKEKSE